MVVVSDGRGFFSPSRTLDFHFITSHLAWLVWLRSDSSYKDKAFDFITHSFLGCVFYHLRKGTTISFVTLPPEGYAGLSQSVLAGTFYRQQIPECP